MLLAAYTTFKLVKLLIFLPKMEAFSELCGESHQDGI